MGEKAERLRKILTQNIDHLEGASFGFPFDEIPDFELHPLDYLQFAEQSLSDCTKSGLINCVGNLKRAVDCQLDNFLYNFNLYPLFKKRNLKFNQKLEFLSTVGIFSSRSLSRFNSMRNKMEHEYSVPEVQDIEVYFDLVSAFISILESASSQVRSFDFDIFGDNLDGDLEIEYVREEPLIQVKVSFGYSKNVNTEKISVLAKDEIEEFAFFFKALRLLSQFFMKSSGRAYLLSKIQE